ncbi:Protein CBR-LGC-21 [Caenorhabditis briggsae]|uniref:Protein CBR-LGC-21 n=1 Tax=Caenorhabditis briggsae TaxID=6238 RepID=A8X513_CAEBR|nr:Protein CBR-LGC-21 [Caenorhabditis briggsae]CAP27723.2 Protein CBR-LGC-21 [Caenorhabditis briggsae]
MTRFWLFILPLLAFARAQEQNQAVANQAGPHIVNSPNALFQARATGSVQLDPCQYMLQMLNQTNKDLMQHEENTLEQCLYYFLAGESAKKLARLNIPHPIASIPPNYVSQQPVTINFAQFTLQHFELNEHLKDISIHGYLELNWHDDRLVWSQDTWKKNKLVVHSFHHVWVPLLGSQNPENHLKNGDAFEIRKVETTNQGNVTAKVAFSLRTFCDDTDFENYPNDEVIQFTSSGLPIFTDPKNFRDYGWGVSGTVPESFDDPSEIAQLGFCLNLKRAHSSLKVELAIPLFITTVLFLLPPLFGSVKIQIYIKMFVMGLQFVTLLIFSIRMAPFLGSTSATPKPVRYLEVALVFNLISITTSIVLFCCMQVKRTLPPWGRVTQFANFINGFLGVLHITGIEDINLEKYDEQVAQTSYQKDWNNVFRAAHAVFMAAISAIVIFVYIVYCL